jgi:hypothetical protein
MPRDVCYYNSTNKKCEACASAKGDDVNNCIRQSDLSPDYPVLNLPDATGRNALDVVCQDWPAGEWDEQHGRRGLDGRLSKDGCLGFAFTLPDNPVGNKTYNDVGAKHTQCFQEAAWKNYALARRAQPARRSHVRRAAPADAVRLLRRHAGHAGHADRHRYGDAHRQRRPDQYPGRRCDAYYH